MFPRYVRTNRNVPDIWTDTVFAWCQIMYKARINVKGTHFPTPQETLSFSLNQVIAGRAVRMLAGIAGTVSLLFLVMLLPGAIIVALPGGIAAASKVYDEARLIRFLKYGDPINPGSWERAEEATEMARLRASYKEYSFNQFSR